MPWIIRRSTLRLAVLIVSMSIAVPLMAQQDTTPGLNDPYYPQTGNLGYDVQHYTLDLNVDVAENFIAASVDINAVAQETLSRLILDFSGFNIHTVSVNGSEPSFARTDNKLIVNLDSAITAEQSFNLKVDYTGIPQGLADPATPWRETGWLNYDKSIFVAGAPSGAMAWFPGNHHPLDKAQYTFRITTSNDYVAAANGLLEERIVGDTSTTHIWQHRLPMSSHLAAVYIGQFEVAQEVAAAIPITNYFPADLSSEARQAFARTPEMIRFYESMFGPYPFESYGVVVVKDPMFPALENQTLSVFGVAAVQEAAAAHELVHQWFGDSVTISRWQDMWLSEGFATYFSALWLAETEGPQAFDNYMNGIYTSLESMPPIRIADPGVERLYDIGIYFRGAWTLHSLRLRLGDETFFNIIKAYATRFQYGNASTDDFIAVAEELSGEDLESFFDAWLYQSAVPPPF